MSKQIPLSQGKVAIVDDADFEWLSQWKWSYMPSRKTGYAKRSIYPPRNGQKQKCTTLVMHRVVLNVAQGVEVDHLNGNGLDNRRENLRLATRSQQMRNRRVFKNSRSGFRCVRFDRQAEKFVATLWLGQFDTAEAAAAAHNRAERLVFGEQH